MQRAVTEPEIWGLIIDLLNVITGRPVNGRIIRFEEMGCLFAGIGHKCWVI